MNMDLYWRYVLEFAVILPSAVGALLPVRQYFRFSQKRVWLITASICLSFVFSGAFLCARFDLQTNILLLPSLIFLFLLYSYTINTDTARKLFCFLTASMLFGFCSTYTNYLMAPSELGNSSGVFTVVSGGVCLGLCAVLFAVYYRIFTVKLPYLLSAELLDHLWRWILLFPLVITLLNLWITPLDPELILEGRIRKIVCLTFPLFPASIVVFFQIFWWGTNTIIESTRLQQENTLLKLEEKRYDELRKYMDDTRTLRHDTRQHLLAIQEYCRTGETEKLADYVQPLLEKAEQPHSRLCLNSALDAVASHYLFLAQSGKIDIEFHLDLPEELPMREADLCAILGNLLDNAVTAVSALPPDDRWINVNARMLSDIMLGLSVKNPYAGDITLGKNGLPRSGRIGHGVGLTSVSTTVHQYNGSLDIQTANGVFSVGILLYTPN